MPRYWVGVASREHVMKGVAGGFAQLCHGEQNALKKMKPGDWIIYYSPTEKFGEKIPCRCFTAIGQIDAIEPYQYLMNGDFTPWRRNVTFLSAQEVPIEPLIDTLLCITSKTKWGFIFRRGFFEIGFDDFALIASAMGIKQ